jgi:tRNA(Ile2) C34 agmatinyltransferase TiaS
MMSLFIMMGSMIPVLALELWGLMLIVTSVTAHWDETRCPQCNYDLRGRRANSLRCPECGCSLSGREPAPSITRNQPRFWYGTVLMILGGGLFALAILLASAWI